jgi:hypothetical protein
VEGVSTGWIAESSQRNSAENWDGVSCGGGWPGATLGRKLELSAAISCATICEADGDGASCCEVRESSQASVE